MRRAVLADTNRVVCENVKVRKLGQGRQTNRSPAVICKYGECCARRAKQPVVRYAVEDRAHAMLAYPEANVAPAGIVAAKIPAVLNVIHRRSVQISAAAHKQRHRLRDRLQDFAAGFASRQFRVLRKLRDLRQEIGWHFSREAVIEQLRFVGVFCAPRIVSFFPATVLDKQFLLMLGKIAGHVLRDEIMLVGQAERLASSIDEFCACFTVRFVSARHFGNSFADQSMRDNELRFAVIAAPCDIERIKKFSHVMTIDLLDIKAVGLHPFAGILALRVFRGGVERHGV